jgi:Ca-activated chloride channel family protein
VASVLLSPAAGSVLVKQKLVITVILLFGLIGSARSAQKSVPDPSIRVDLDVVLVPVTVTDSQNRPVEGLHAENFRIWEEKVEQKIQYFSSEDTPVSVGLVFDTSGSMSTTLDTARSAASTFLKTGNPEDEYFLIEFNDRPRIAQNFTTNVDRLQSDLIFDGAHGFTAFLDAVYLAIEHVRLGNYPRKALLMITDGEDNHSRYTLDDIKELLKESDVQLYAIDTSFSHYSKTRNAGRELLQELADLTGGRAAFPNSIGELGEICSQISLELKSQYVLGYLPSNTTTDGKWRKLRVKVNPPTGMSHVNVRAKPGYYATPLGHLD